MPVASTTVSRAATWTALASSTWAIRSSGATVASGTAHRPHPAGAHHEPDAVGVGDRKGVVVALRRVVARGPEALHHVVQRLLRDEHQLAGQRLAGATVRAEGRGRRPVSGAQV